MEIWLVYAADVLPCKVARFYDMPVMHDLGAYEQRQGYLLISSVLSVYGAERNVQFGN